MQLCRGGKGATRLGCCEQVEVYSVAVAGPVDEFQLVGARGVPDFVGEPGIWVAGGGDLGVCDLNGPQCQTYVQGREKSSDVAFARPFWCWRTLGELPQCRLAVLYVRTSGFQCRKEARPVGWDGLEELALWWQ